LRDHDIALDPLRARRRRRRQRAGVDPVGPVGEQAQGALRVDPADIVDHVLARLADLNARFPRLERAREMPEPGRDRAGRRVAELVAGVAAVGLDDLQPLSLGLQGLGHAVAPGAGAGELAGRRHVQHRVPVKRRIILRRGLAIRRGRGGQVYRLARRTLHLGAVDKTVSARPQRVIRLRQAGNEVAALVVGDDDLRIAGRQIGGLGDHPDTGFRAARAGDDAADLIVLDRRLLRPGRAGHGEGKDKGNPDNELRQAAARCAARPHAQALQAALL
jgi:hypothetical protein